MMISRNKQERALYESRQKLQRDVYTALAEKLDEGRAEGREEGREEGRAEGRAEAVRAQVQFLQQRLRHDTIAREQLRTLSPSELDNLLEQLQAELDAKLGLNS